MCEQSLHTEDWHFLLKGLRSSFQALWEKHHSIRNICMVVHLTVMDSSQFSTSWSPCPERALISSIVIGWGADAMMSSILNKDFISMRLMVQGKSLKTVWNFKVRYYIIALKAFIKRWDSESGYTLYWTCKQDDSSSNYKWMSGIGFVSPLVEENKHRYAMQRLSREYWQQLDTGWRYLSNVDRVHHELWKHKDRVKQFQQSVLNTVNTWSRLSRNIQWQKSSL